MQEEDIRESVASQRGISALGEASASSPRASLRVGAGLSETVKAETEKTYRRHEEKIRELDTKLPQLKAQIREFFALSTGVGAVFLQIDDFYHLNRMDQPLVMDYVHRLCKDLPLYFKVATLKHATTLYADREGQPIGAQERHDYQPINIDFTFSDFRNREIRTGNFARVWEAGFNDS